MCECDRHRHVARYTHNTHVKKYVTEVRKGAHQRESIGVLGSRSPQNTRTRWAELELKVPLLPNGPSRLNLLQDRYDQGQRGPEMHPEQTDPGPRHCEEATE